MSNIFYKNDFNISIENIDNGILCNIISWEINNFNTEFKIINYTDKLLILKLKNSIICEIDFNNMNIICNNQDLEKLIRKSLDYNVITFLNNFNIMLKNNNFDNNCDNEIVNWNPYDYLDIKKKYSFNISLLKENAYKKKINNLYVSNEYVIDIILNEIINLDENNFELIFKDDDIFNFDINLKIKELYNIRINIDLSSYYYPNYPPIISFYDNFNDNLENRLVNLPFLNVENWNPEYNLKNVIECMIDIINENLSEIYQIDNDYKNLNLIISKIISLNKIKIFNSHNLNLSEKKNLYFIKNKEDIYIKNNFEIKLFTNLLNELIELKKDESLNNFLKNSDLSYIIEYYIKKFNFDELNIINNYKIYNIIFSIVDKIEYNIINIEKYNILKEKVYRYNTKKNVLDSYKNIMKNLLVTESLFKKYYFENYHCSSIIYKNSIKKITEELIDYKNLANNESSIFLTYDKFDCKKLMALIIGPKNSIYENGCFIFHILCDDYPNKCPKIHFEKNDIIPLINQNLENKISKSWNKSGIISFLNLIKSNIFNYNFDSKINYQIYKYSLLDKLTNPDEEFKEVIINHFILKKNNLILNLQNNNNFIKLNQDIIDKLIKL